MTQNFEGILRLIFEWWIITVKWTASIIQINVILSNWILQHSIVNKFMPSSVLVGFVTMCCFRKYPYFPCLRRDFNLSPSHPFGDSTSSSHFPLNIIIILSVRHPSPLGISSDLLRAACFLSLWITYVRLPSRKFFCKEILDGDLHWGLRGNIQQPYHAIIELSLNLYWIRTPNKNYAQFNHCNKKVFIYQLHCFFDIS